MKTTALVFLGILLCLPVYVTAQDEERSAATNEISTGTLHILFSEFYMGYEKRVDRNGFMLFGLAEDSETHGSERIGLQGGLQYRRYNLMPAGEDYYNWYAGLLACCGFKTITESANSATANYMKVGIIIGVKILTTSKMFMDLNLGEIYQYSTASSSPDSELFGRGYTGVAYSGFRPQVNWTIGIRF
jgi:hypothetical protein